MESGIGKAILNGRSHPSRRTGALEPGAFHLSPPGEGWGEGCETALGP
jgi:hypothetical protein